MTMGLKLPKGLLSKSSTQNSLSPAQRRLEAFNFYYVQRLAGEGIEFLLLLYMLSY